LPWTAALERASAAATARLWSWSRDKPAGFTAARIRSTVGATAERRLAICKRSVRSSSRVGSGGRGRARGMLMAWERRRAAPAGLESEGYFAGFLAAGFAASAAAANDNDEATTRLSTVDPAIFHRDIKASCRSGTASDSTPYFMPR